MGAPGLVAEAISKDAADAPAHATARGGRRLAIDPVKVGNNLAALVLAVLELLRQLLLRQAIRRMESGLLRDEQIESIGTAMMRLEETMTELKRHFGLTDDDLNLDLGPIGRLF